MGRHLPLGVLLRDHRHVRRRRRCQVHDDAGRCIGPPRPPNPHLAAPGAEPTWRHQGVLSLDVFPEQMTAPLVNRYLEIKARHLL